MSKFVDEIIEDLKARPLTWFDYRGFGCKKGNITLYGYGNSKLASIVNVQINGDSMPTTFIDRWRLEKAIGRWYKNASLDQLSKS